MARPGFLAGSLGASLAAGWSGGRVMAVAVPLFADRGRHGDAMRRCCPRFFRTVGRAGSLITEMAPRGREGAATGP